MNKKTIWITRPTSQNEGLIKRLKPYFSIIALPLLDIVYFPKQQQMEKMQSDHTQQESKMQQEINTLFEIFIL